MKIKVIFTFLILSTLTALLSVSGLAGVGPLSSPSLQAGAPTVVSYQGQVTVSGSPYNGTGYFKFAIVNSSGDTTYWSNDGTSTNGGEPNNGSLLIVSNGLFNALLGDPSLTHMTQALTASVFDGTERYLRVWFSSDNINFQQLSPDQPFTAVPYAFQAKQAADADTLDGAHASEFAGTGHSHAGLLPAGALLMSKSDSDTTLIGAGFSYTGMVFEPGWFSRADMPTGRNALESVAVDGVIYTIGGSSSVNQYENANEAYDPVTNTWSTKAGMPTGRYHLDAAAVDGVIYAIGGSSKSNGFETTNEAYDPSTNSWSRKADMPTGRYGLAAVMVDGIIYAIGGWSISSGYETANEAYDPDINSWSTKADMPTGRYHLAAEAVEGIIYAVGGNSGVPETKNEAYDPDTNSWSTKADMPTGRSYVEAAAVEGVIYAVGGFSATNADLKENQAYDVETNSWSIKADMPTGRNRFSISVVDGVIYAIGGHSSSVTYLTNTEAYTPALYVYTRE
jgi:N-acetylneuraminic acid mutarotase